MTALIEARLGEALRRALDGTLADRREAARAVENIMGERKFGQSGSRIVIEEFLEGPEVSVSPSAR